MKKIDTLKEIQEIELEMLDYFAKICEENNLRYFLAGGTLLGAIRHKGFIPWDNDVDVSMPREDYNKLILLLNNNHHDYYRILKISNNNNYYLPFIKLVDSRTLVRELNQPIEISNLGVFLDIFPIDGVSSIRKIAKLEIKITSSLMWTLGMLENNTYIDKEVMPKRFLKKFFVYLWKKNNKEKLCEKIERRMIRHNFDTSKLCASTYGLRVEKEIIEQKYFSDYINVEFENRLYRAPIGYDQYLCQMYGDYMKLPPKDKQVAPHDIETYWKDEA